MSDSDKRLTISVPEAARKYLGLRSKDAAYAAAHEGIIPTIRVGRLLRVPVAAMERVLDQVGPAQA
jgi:excisionase family DNA binding protein